MLAGLHRSHLGRIPSSLRLLALCASLVSQVSAFETQLTPADVREAWMLGQRNDQATSEFLAPYAKLSASEQTNTPHVAETEVLTPFAQVVDRSRERTGGDYSEEQALRDYKQRGNTILVRVRVMLPSAYPKQESGPGATSPPPTPEQEKALRPENFWQHYQFNLKQNGKTIAPRFVHNKPIYSAPSKNTPSVLDGATVWLDYDVKSVASGLTTLEIITPESKTISSTFDLKTLR